MSTKEIQEKIVENMSLWQRVEDASMASTGNAFAATTNPVIRTVMEIIQRDSLMHHRVQQLIIDSLRETVTLSTDDLEAVWDIIEEHNMIEKKTLEFANGALDAIKGKNMVLQEYILEYLLADETKHDQMLERLEGIKKGMYPTG